MKLLDSMKVKLLLIFLCTLFSINVSALTFEVNGVYYTAISETEVKVVQNPLTGYSGDIVIAEEVTHDGMTFAVTAIAENAFSQDSLMTSVTIPKSVTNIHEWAFEYCYGLQSVIVAADNPNYCSVNGALYNKAKTELRYCPGATNGRFDVEEGVTDILAPAFIDCRNVSIIGIPASTNNIQISFVRGSVNVGGDSFAFPGSSFNYPALQKFDISPENQSYHFENGILYNKAVTEILKVLGSVPEVLELPEGITVVSNDSFRRKFNLKKVIFPSSLTTIGSDAFDHCTNLETVSFEKCDKLEYIGDRAFDGAPINSVSLPGSVRNIGDEVFTNVKEFSLSEGPTEFNFNSLESVFYSNIETIHLPSTIKTITLSEGWRGGIKNLKSLVIESGGEYKTVNNVLFNADMTHLYMCAPKGVLGEYKIPSTVTTISDYAFSYNTTITKLTVPGTVKILPSGVGGLRTLILEEGVEEIRNSAFQGAPLIQISIPSSLNKVDYWAFNTNIIEVYSFSDSFDDYEELRGIGIYGTRFLHTKDEPSQLRHTDNGFVYYLDSDIPVLVDYDGESKEVVMPETIEGKVYRIDYHVFNMNTKIETLTLPNNKSLADFPSNSCFNQCRDYLKKVIIPSGTAVGDISSNIFYNVTPEIILSPENKNFVYENNILYDAKKSKLIAYNNFEDNSFVVPNTVREICSYALNDDFIFARESWHDNLKSIKLNSNYITLNSHAFHLTACKNLVIPDNVTLKRNAISLFAKYYYDEPSYIELGKGNYESGSIYWLPSEYYYNPSKPEYTYVNIKCNFNDPGKVNCPFSIDQSDNYDITNVAILNVPYGTKEKFQNAPGWSNFRRIVENFEYVATKHQLTYLLDGEIYKQESVEVGAEIFAIPSPQKEGYLFSGWIAVPETMGDEDVVVNGYLYKLGDVNSDTRINVADIDETVDLILGAKDIKKELAADVNNDKAVNVGDINGIANYIQKGSFTIANAPRRSAVESAPLLTLSSTSIDNRCEAIMEVCLDNSADDITSLQLDLSMPEGLSLNADAGITAVADRTNGHQLSWKRQDDGTIRVVFYSASNDQFKKNSGAIIRLNITSDNLAEGEYKIDVNNIVMVSNSGELYYSNTTGVVNVLGTTDIKKVNTEDNKPAVIYDINGRKLNSPKKGLNVINGQKVIFK